MSSKHGNFKHGFPKCLDCGKQLKVYSAKKCKSCVKKGNNSGILGAISRWKGHVKVIKVDTGPKKWTRSYDKVIQVEKKRFRNLRYKTRKDNAEGDHSFEDWLILKSFYKNMCLCCKQFEPDIKLTEDHIIPLSMGGSNDINNIQPLCLSCNVRKHAKALTYLTIGDNGSFMRPPASLDEDVNN